VDPMAVLDGYGKTRHTRIRYVDRPDQYRVAMPSTLSGYNLKLNNSAVFPKTVFALKQRISPTELQQFSL
jgi:hypothetical protein